MRAHRFRSLLALATLSAVAVALLPASSYGADPRRPAPGSPAYVARDLQNMQDAYGRITGPGGQLQNPAYLAVARARRHGRPDLAADGAGRLTDPDRGDARPGGPRLERRQPAARRLERHPRPERADLVHQPLRRAAATAPSTAPSRARATPTPAQVLRGPFPGVVITEGSVQGSEGMYRWLAQDLAERGYVVLTYDVQGQGGGETLPHEPVPGGDSNALPFCNPFADAAGRRAVRLPRRAGPAAVQLRGRHRGRAVVLHLDARRSTTPTRAPRARR